MKQELFDRIWDWFVVKGNPRATEAECCRYRTHDGRRCAAGVLLADEHYRPDFEGKMAEQAAVAYALVASGVPRDDLFFVMEMQRAHDGAFDAEDMAIRFRRVAERHRLTVR